MSNSNNPEGGSHPYGSGDENTNSHSGNQPSTPSSQTPSTSPGSQSQEDNSATKAYGSASSVTNAYGDSTANNYGSANSHNSYNPGATGGYNTQETSGFNGAGYSGFGGQYSDYNAAGEHYGAQQQGYAQNQGAPQFGAYPNQDPNYGQVGTQKDSFFGALFDFSFTKYATPSVVKAIYILAMISIGLLVFIGLIASVIAMFSDGAAFALLLIPLILLGGLFYVAMIRVGLEVSIAMIRTSQSVQSIDARQAREEVANQNYSGPFGG